MPGSGLLEAIILIGIEAGFAVSVRLFGFAALRSGKACFLLLYALFIFLASSYYTSRTSATLLILVGICCCGSALMQMLDLLMNPQAKNKYEQKHARDLPLASISSQAQVSPHRSSSDPARPIPSQQEDWSVPAEVAAPERDRQFIPPHPTPQRFPPPALGTTYPHDDIEAQQYENAHSSDSDTPSDTQSNSSNFSFEDVDGEESPTNAGSVMSDSDDDFMKI